MTTTIQAVALLKDAADALMVAIKHANKLRRAVYIYDEHCNEPGYPLAHVAPHLGRQSIDWVERLEYQHAQLIHYLHQLRIVTEVELSSGSENAPWSVRPYSLADLVLAVADLGAPIERTATLAINNILANADGELPVRIGEPDFATEFHRLVMMEFTGELTATQTKQVLAEMLDSGDSPEKITATRGFEALTDEALTALVDDTIAADVDAWAKFCAGEDKVAGVFVGAIMKSTRGQANGGAVIAQLEARRSAS